jgi:2-methylaconitate cis-trans-isomerase PrpF
MMQALFRSLKSSDASITANVGLHLRPLTTTPPKMRQSRLPASYYRGGTSRAIIFQQHHLPPSRSLWPPIFLACLGSPDPSCGRQLDGLGGGISSLSKICVVGPSTRNDADVDYTFAAVGVRDSTVDFEGNCGNMSNAIGPFAVDSGIFPSKADGVREDVTMRIHNTNTGKIIHSTFAVEDGEAVASGDFAIEGVSGTGARIKLDFLDPAGSKTGKLLPTENVVDEFDGIRTSCVDVGNPACFVHAGDLGARGDLTPDEIGANERMMMRLESIRRQAAVSMGLATTAELVPASIPKICMVSPAELDSGMDFRVRAISVRQPHKAVPITMALACAAAARLEGSVVYECCSVQPVSKDGVTIGHASGKLLVGARFAGNGDLKYATIYSTARRLMEGTIFWKG